MPIGTATEWLGLLPVFGLLDFRARQEHRGYVFWWIAAAYAVSWAADLGAHWIDADVIGNVYPITQVAFLALALLAYPGAAMVASVLAWVALAGLLWHGPAGVDVLLRTTANALAVWMAFRAAGFLRWSLLVTFGLGGGLWLWYAYVRGMDDGGWLTRMLAEQAWLAYQTARIGGVLLFLAAVWRIRTVPA